jgi:hypothetical protein
MKVVEAVRISMSVPIFFRPYRFDGDLYIDGGTTNGYPIAFITTDMYKLLNNYDNDKEDSKPIGLETATNKLYDLDADIDTKNPVFQKHILNKTIGIKTFTKSSMNYIKPRTSIETQTNFNVIT